MDNWICKSGDLRILQRHTSRLENLFCESRFKITFNSKVHLWDITSGKKERIVRRCKYPVVIKALVTAVKVSIFYQKSFCAMMRNDLIYLFVVAISQVNSQPACEKLGSAYSTICPNMVSHDILAASQGVPGKRGPIGEKGERGLQGSKGIKGNAGEVDYGIVEEILSRRMGEGKSRGINWRGLWVHGCIIFNVLVVCYASYNTTQLPQWRPIFSIRPRCRDRNKSIWHDEFTGVARRKGSVSQKIHPCRSGILPVARSTQICDLECCFRQNLVSFQYRGWTTPLNNLTRILNLCYYFQFWTGRLWRSKNYQKCWWKQTRESKNSKIGQVSVLKEHKIRFDWN